MIPYQKSFIGLKLLFRIHGSPLFRATIPGIIAVGILLLLERIVFPDPDEENYNLDHPYGIGVLISSVSLLIIFRANYGYQRYWNACGDTHHMMSKWLDVAIHTGIYHLQSSRYDCIKPPNYFDNHDLNRFRLTRDREKEDDFFAGSKCDQQIFRQRRKKRKSIESLRNNLIPGHSPSTQSDMSVASFATDGAALVDNSRYLIGEGRLDGGWGSAFGDSTSTFHENSGDWKRGNSRGFASTYPGGRTPSLFLQELVHLTSLLSAVALSTLRNDIDSAESPLDMYHPGSMFPKTDPKIDIRQTEQFTTLKYLFGCDRSPASRTKYNAARPLAVMGGISQNEIKFIQRAKGPSAKVALVSGWLAEFIIREDRAGTLGIIGPPIISRVMQFISDGMIFYNHCRKTMFVPFPFPHAQLSAFFNLTMIIAIPLLMHQYSNKLWLGALLTFMTVTCLSGLHEVARELENPFRNIPNEIPLFTLQAMFNESLITVYSGYHPDHFWNGDEYRQNADMFGACQNGDGRPSSRRIKTPPPSPVRKKQLYNMRSPLSRTRSCGTDQLVSVSELQQMVTKQSDEIKRLSEKYEPTPSASKEEHDFFNSSM